MTTADQALLTADTEVMLPSKGKYKLLHKGHSAVQIRVDVLTSFWFPRIFEVVHLIAVKTRIVA